MFTTMLDPGTGGGGGGGGGEGAATGGGGSAGTSADGKPATVGKTTDTSGSQGNQKFNLDSWDGNTENLPEDYKKFHAKSTELSSKKNGQDLVNALARRWADANKPQQPQQPRKQVSTVDDEDGNDPGKTPVTKAELDRYIQETEAKRNRASAHENFRQSILDVVGKPTQFGDATIAFSNENEVTEFEAFIKQKLGPNGLTGKDFLILHRIEQILKQHGTSAVRKFESELSNKNKTQGSQQKRDGANGNRQNADNNNDDQNAQGKSKPGRHQSLQKYIELEDPALFERIKSGELELS